MGVAVSSVSNWLSPNPKNLATAWLVCVTLAGVAVMVSTPSTVTMPTCFAAKSVSGVMLALTSWPAVSEIMA